MKSTFAGFSEEDLKRIKSGTSNTDDDTKLPENIRRLDKIGGQLRRPVSKKVVSLQNHLPDETSDLHFEKCRLSLTVPSPKINVNEDEVKDENSNTKVNLLDNVQDSCNLNKSLVINAEKVEKSEKIEDLRENSSRKSSISAPDIVEEVSNCKDEPTTNKINLEELQLKQKLMEEQNKKRKEMLSKALADRTRQTEEEVLKLEKIKKELQVLDGQFSQDVAVLRKKIDQACLNYAEAEKHYLKIEKEFLQAKINLQKEREKKELLTEHLCALITHNETRKAKKLETLMLELATDRKHIINGNNIMPISKDGIISSSDDEETIVIDGVCQKTGKFVDINIL